VYIKEAHPLDEWQMDENEKQGVCYRQPKNFGDRMAIARDFTQRFHYRVPLAVDGIENRADALYAGWPERLYVIDESGKVVYKGEPGPFGYHPEEVEAWLRKRFPGVASKAEETGGHRVLSGGVRMEGSG
jgi:Iodothyronine deiodinase